MYCPACGCPYNNDEQIYCNREVEIHRFRFTGTGITILFFNFSYLPVISTRFPGVNHRLPVQHKRVNQTRTFLHIEKL